MTYGKRIIRKNTFETNSSSTHTLTIYTAKKWNEFKAGNKYLADWYGELFLIDDLIEEMKKKAIKDPELYKDVDLNDRASCIEFLVEEDKWGYSNYFTYETWGSYDKWSDWAESYEEKFTTPSGDKMVAVGAYGYNG